MRPMEFFSCPDGPWNQIKTVIREALGA